MSEREGRLQGRVQRLRWAAPGLVLGLVFTVVVVPVGVSFYVQEQIETAQDLVSCRLIQANIAQLHALRSISHRLGIPADFRVPVLPEECDWI